MLVVSRCTWQFSDLLATFYRQVVIHRTGVGSRAGEALVALSSDSLKLVDMAKDQFAAEEVHR